MPQTPRLWCADCNKVMHWQPASLPQGQAKCRQCRAAARGGVVGDHAASSRAKIGAVTCTCTTCEVTFISARAAGTRDRYCSDRCRNRRPRGKVQQQCEACGATFRANYTGQRTCGRWCGSFIKNGYWPRTALRWCQTCGTPAATWGQTRCSCHAQREPSKYPSCRVFVTCCQMCATWFCSPYTISTCSAVCAQEKEREDKRQSKDRRRAAFRGAFVEKVYRKRIYERDGWRCKLCGKKVKRDAKVPHPLAPTLDHIVPLACGGQHEAANCQTAHYLCNSRKAQYGGGEQLLLIG